MNDAEDRDRIEDEAAAWVWRLDHGHPTARDRCAFEQWLTADPRHGEACSAYTDIWNELGACQLARARVRDTGSETEGSKTTWPFNWLRPAGVLACGMIAAVAIGLFVDQAPKEVTRYQTAVGEQKSITLADGSTVNLNTDSVIAVDYDDSRRLIRLERGEAYFEVASNREQPFIVYAGNTVVRAVGTQFSLHRRDARTLDIIVTEGVTQVTTFGAPPPDELKSLLQQEQRADVQTARVEAGLGIEITERLGAAWEVSSTEIAKRLAWREGRLVFEGETLEQAIAELDRYYSAELIITDAALRQLQVGGYFKTDDIDNLLKSLEKVLPINVHRINRDLVHLIPAG